MNFDDPTHIFIIAEAGSNWKCGTFEQDLNQAKNLIKIASNSGADAIKFQTYRPETTYVSNPGGSETLSYSENIDTIFEKHAMPYEMIPKLVEFCKEENILFMSSPFSVDDAKAIDPFTEIHKVASFEMTDLPLIKKISKTKKPIIISTGMASMVEIESAFNTAKRNGAKDITLLYCVSNYPSKNSDFNLNNIRILKKRFNCRVGLSDHSKDNRIAIAAVAAGAEVIEKHIALNNQKIGLDIEFSLKGKEIKKFKDDIDLAHNLFKKTFFYRDVSEQKSKIFRRSIFVIKDIKKGEKFSVNNIKRIRPGHGLEPKYYDKVLNKKSPLSFNRGEPLSKKILSKLKIKK